MVFLIHYDHPETGDLIHPYKNRPSKYSCLAITSLQYFLFQQFEYREQALEFGKELDRVRKSTTMHSSNIHQYETRSINKVCCSNEQGQIL